jgi:hypothetical protein
MGKGGWPVGGPMDFATQLHTNFTAAHVQDRFIFIAELTLCVSNPATFAHVVFGSYGIVPDKPQPDFDLQGDLCFPQMFERTINTITAQIFVHRFHKEFSIFCSFRNWLISTRSQSNSAENIVQFPYSILQTTIS